MNMAWKSRLIAYPYANQKKILRIADIINIAQTSIENVPKDFCSLISFSCDTYPVIGAIATMISKIIIFYKLTKRSLFSKQRLLLNI